MSWGCGWGSTAGKGAREVAEAFYAGKSRTRGDARTDGRTYWLKNNPIAHRIPEDEIPGVVADILAGGKPLFRHALEFTWAGWPTDMTARHLDALGVPGIWRGSESQRNPRPPEICGKPVKISKWYTLEEAAALPAWVDPPKQRRTQFVNLTIRTTAW